MEDSLSHSEPFSAGCEIHPFRAGELSNEALPLVKLICGNGKRHRQERHDHLPIEQPNRVAGMTLPVLEVDPGMHIIADPILPLGKVMHDYLASRETY